MKSDLIILNLEFLYMEDKVLHFKLEGFSEVELHFVNGRFKIQGKYLTPLKFLKFMVEKKVSSDSVFYYEENDRGSGNEVTLHMDVQKNVQSVAFFTGKVGNPIYWYKLTIGERVMKITGGDIEVLQEEINSCRVIHFQYLINK